MRSAYVELEYRRQEDGLPITLIAALPTVREIAIGGATSELRLPGASPDAVYALIHSDGEQFTLTPAAGVTDLCVNDQPVGPEGVWLVPYDVISVGNYRLTAHEGEPSPDPPLIDTHLRWKVRPPTELDEDESFDPSVRPHIEDFELSTRPALQAQRFADVQKRAEAELQRVIRAPDADGLEGYVEYLWLTRLRMAREAGDPHAGDYAREAYDLFPENSLIMVSCGIVFLGEDKWADARSAFERVLRRAGRTVLPAVHDARLGRILADHMTRLTDSQRRQDCTPAGALESRGWDVPRIRLSVPGDEVLLWRIAWHGRVFANSDRVRFVFCGKEPELPAAPGELLRWEIHDLKRKCASRRLIEIPDPTLADPSLALEVGGLRNALSQYNAFTNLFVDRSAQSEAEPAPPVRFDDTALAQLPESIGRREVAHRLSQRDGRLHLEVVLKIQRGDIVYRQGRHCVAVHEPLAREYSGATLRCNGKRDFWLETPTGSGVVVHYHQLPLLSRPLPTGGWRIVFFCAAVVILARLIAWLVR